MMKEEGWRKEVRRMEEKEGGKIRKEERERKEERGRKKEERGRK